MENEEQYRESTEQRDWKAIFKFNNTTIDTFGTRKELDHLGGFLEPGEIVYALASGVVSQTHTSNNSDFGANTWLVALTSERFLFIDCALLSNSVDTQTIRLDRVQAVSASQGWILGKITVDIGNRAVIVDNCQKAHVKAMADIANKLLRERERGENKKPNQTAVDARSQSSSTLDKLAALERLAALKTAGVLSEEEFTEAKAKILNSL